MKTIITLAVALLVAISANAQEIPKLRVSGYLEMYYGYDFNEPTDNNRPAFIYSHHRNNEVNLNLGFIKAAYDGEKIRANLAFMAGTYSNANLAAEPGVFKNVFEANVGLKLSDKQQIWLDAGIFPSHIGFESAISKDCWVLTRNISSENTPYYESGVKISFISLDGNFSASLLYLNGWQRINRQNGNSKPAGGVQLNYKATDKLTFNYSNYLGSEGENKLAVTRIYHNLYAIAQLTNKFGITAGFDYATQQKVKGQTEKSEIISPVLIAQYKFKPKWAIAARAEYYKDRDGIFIATTNANGFKTSGYSMNLDYSPVSNALVRLEGKRYESREKVFAKDAGTSMSNTALTASIAIAF